MRSQSSPEFHQDLVGLLGESGGRPGLRGGDIELDRVGDQFEFARADQIFVGPNLRVVGRLQRVLHRRPWSCERRKAFAPLGKRAGCDHLGQDLHRICRIGGDLLAGGETRIVDELRRSMCRHTSAQNLVGCIITKEM